MFQSILNWVMGHPATIISCGGILAHVVTSKIPGLTPFFNFIGNLINTVPGLKNNP